VVSSSRLDFNDASPAGVLKLSRNRITAQNMKFPIRCQRPDADVAGKITFSVRITCVKIISVTVAIDAGVGGAIDADVAAGATDADVAAEAMDADADAGSIDAGAAAVAIDADVAAVAIDAVVVAVARDAVVAAVAMDAGAAAVAIDAAAAASIDIDGKRALT